MREFIPRNARSPVIVPMLIVVPFWAGDMPQALEMLKVMAGLQDTHAGQTAHVMLVNRKDCKPDPNLVKTISPKFNVITYQSQSNQTGWPSGPNGIFGDTMIRICNYQKDKYDCVYWMEPDNTPLHPNWILDLTKEWKNRHSKAMIVGHRHDCHGDGTGDHISGSCLYHPNIARRLPQITASQAAWDYEHRAMIVRNGQHTDKIFNLYKARDVDPNTLEQFVKEGRAVVHGIKDDSGIRWVKAKYGI